MGSSIKTYDDADVTPIYEDADVSIETASPQETVVPTNPALPKKSLVDEMIGQRDDSVKTLLDEIEFQGTKKYANFLSDDAMEDPFVLAGDILTAKPLRTALVTGLKTVGIPFQRAESALANPALEMQDGNFDPGKLLDTFIAGVKGEKVGQFGDLIRTTGVGGHFNEPLAATTGLVAMSGFDKLANKGEITKQANKFFSAIPERLPKFMGKDFLYKRAELAKEGLDGMRKSLGAEFDQVYGKSGNKLIKDPSILNEALEDLPEKVKNAVLRDTKKALKLKPDDNITPTLKNVQILRQHIDEYIPDKVWRFGDDAASIEDRFVHKSRTKIAQAMADTEPELREANNRFSEFMDMYKQINKILLDTSTGEVKDTGLRNLYKLGQDRGKQIAFEKFNAMLPKTQQVLKDLISYNKRQALKAGTGKVAKGLLYTAGAGYAGHEILKRIRES